MDADLNHSVVPATQGIELPTVAVVSVGDELLAGDVADTNAAWLARELEGLGLCVAMMTTLPDHSPSIASFVGWARTAYDVVVVTGGLGGTPDDVTRDGIAAAFGVTRVVHEEPARALDALGGYAAVFAVEWCSLPEQSRVLPGAAGGPPPFAIENVYVFAGLPAEMEAAFTAVREELRRGSGLQSWRSTYATTEDKVAELLVDAQRLHPAVRIGSYPRGAGEPVLELVARSADEHALELAVGYVQASLAERLIAVASPRTAHRAPLE